MAECDPLENSQHERFAKFVAKGMDGGEAYLKVSPDVTEESAATMAWKLRKVEGVLERIAWLKRQSATKATLTMQERREFLARAVRIKLHALDLESDGDLVQEIDYRSEEEGGGIKKLKLPGKRECLMDDAKLSGELVEKIEHSGNVGVTLEEYKARVKEIQDARKEEEDAGK